MHEHRTDDPEIVDRIIARLARVRAEGLTCFGGKKHRFRPGAPVAEARLAAFEAEHGVRLPEDYRRYLRAIGEGGPAPYYGISPLDDWAHGAEWDDADMAGLLARPNPLSPDATYAADADPHPDRFAGAITLSDEGCTYLSVLIVTGPERGRVVHIDMESAEPVFADPIGLLTYIDRWLERLLGGWSVHGYGYRPTGDQAELRALVGTTTGRRRVDALDALFRAPALDAASVECVRSALDDADPELRRSACWLACRFTLGAADRLVALCDDPVAAVRVMALCAVEGHDPDRAVELARPKLGSDTRDEVLEALRILRKHRRLHGYEVRGLIGHPDPALRQRAVDLAIDYAPRPWPPEVEALIDDPDPDVRRTFMQQIDQLDDLDPVERFMGRLAKEDEPSVVDALIRMLQRRGAARAAPLIADALASDCTMTRYTAVRALADLGDPGAIPALEALLDDHRRPQRTSSDGSVSVDTTLARAAHDAIEALRR